MEKNFKKGDKFIPRKPKENNPDWNEHMDMYNGQVLEVEHITLGGWVKPKQWGVCLFHPDWCEKVSSSEIPNNYNTVPKVGKIVKPMKAGVEGISENMVEGLKQYFKNTSKEEVLKVWEATKEEDFPIYNHIKASTLLPQPQTRAVTIDWEQRRYELAKSAMQGLIVTNWNIYEVPNLVGKSIEIANEMIKQLKEQ